MTYSAPTNLARLAATQHQLAEVANDEPLTAVCMANAMEWVDLAARIIDGRVELNACDECGCTVEDGECEC